MQAILIADSGATKCEWGLITNGKKKSIVTKGISPYFLTEEDMFLLLQKELLPKIKGIEVFKIFYYGTGLSNPENVLFVKRVLKKSFPKATIEATHDMLAAARSVCGDAKGIVNILGTGSNCCFYNGKKITKNSPGLGYALGDEGSGAYLGKKVIQHFLYNIFDEALQEKFIETFQTNRIQILESVYKKPYPNRYLAGFSIFLSQNRGHYIIENILEDSMNDFFQFHITQFKESFSNPIHFVGGAAFAFKDVLKSICDMYDLELGTIIKKPMKGLITYHSNVL